MFGAKYTFITAILMTMAALAWGFNLYVALQAEGDFPLMNLAVFLLFAAFAVGYWIAHFRKNKPHNSGTE